MDDSEPNNNSTHTKEHKHEGYTVQQKHEIKTSQYPPLHDICHLTCNEQNSNVVARLNLGGSPTTQLIVVHRF